MELMYKNEFILNKNNIECQVLDTENVSFEDAYLGRKSKETLVFRAKGGEKIDTLTSKGLVESTYVANEGESIFYNNENDIYVPRNSEGEAWLFDQIETYGYEITEYSKVAIKIKSTKVAKILHEVISKPTCIKDVFGKGSHAFLFEGATLKQDPDTGRITGIDKDAFDTTWEIIKKNNVKKK